MSGRKSSKRAPLAKMVNAQSLRKRAVGGPDSAKFPQSVSSRFRNDSQDDSVFSQDEQDEGDEFISNHPDQSATPSTHLQTAQRNDDSGLSGTGSKQDLVEEAYSAKVPVSLTELFKTELYRGYDFERNSDENLKNSIKVIRFMRVPRELEKFIFVGFFLCCNCFLEFFTFLPLRAILASIQLVPNMIMLKPLHSGHVRDFLRLVLITLSIMTLRYIDISFVYHLIRGEVQSVIKLYVLFNVFDIIDKLFSSFGQDILDALYLHAAHRQNGIFNAIWIGHFLMYFAFSCLYIVLHAMVNLMQFITLNVAMNSANHALLTIIISAQFVELKGSVFKRSGEGNLFQISCSDARERFHILIFLILVGLKNTVQIRSAPGGKTTYFFEQMLPLMGLVFGSEILVDWIKHSFVTRFNNIDSSIYRKFSRILYQDIANGYRGGDYSHSIVRRLGLAPIPLACLVIVAVLPTSAEFGAVSPLHWVLLWGILFCTKMSLSIILLGQACEFQETRNQQETPQSVRRTAGNEDFEFAVRMPLEKPFGGKDKVPLEQTYRYTMTSRIDQ